MNPLIDIWVHIFFGHITEMKIDMNVIHLFPFDVTLHNISYLDNWIYWAAYHIFVYVGGEIARAADENWSHKRILG